MFYNLQHFLNWLCFPDSESILRSMWTSSLSLCTENETVVVSGLEIMELKWQKSEEKMYTENISFHNSQVVLNLMLQYYKTILKKCFLVTGNTVWIMNKSLHGIFHQHPLSPKG